MNDNKHHRIDAGPVGGQDAPATDGGTSDLCFLPCGSRSDAPWFCLQTHPGAEIEAEWRLRYQRFTVYLPQFEIIRSNRQTRIGPLFPGYLFAQVTDHAPSWGPMRSTRGVTTVLVRPGTTEPAPVQSGILQALWKQCAPNGVIYRDRGTPALPPLHAGDRIRVVDGPFANMDGIVRLPGQNRIQVLLGVLGRQAVVTIDRKVVAAT